MAFRTVKTGKGKDKRIRRPLIVLARLLAGIYEMTHDFRLLSPPAEFTVYSRVSWFFPQRSAELERAFWVSCCNSTVGTTSTRAGRSGATAIAARGAQYARQSQVALLSSTTFGLAGQSFDAQLIAIAIKVCAMW